MAWEVFTKKVIRTGEPVITLGKMGRLAFNMGATAILKDRGAEFAVLMWDKAARLCAIKVADSKDSGAYKLTYNERYNGCGFSAVTFLNYIRYDWTETRPFNAEWVADEDMFVFEIPAEYFGTSGDLTQPLGKLKRSDRIVRNEKGASEEAP